MKLVISITILTFFLCFAASTQSEKLYPSNIDLDMYDKIHWKDEKYRLAVFESFLSADENHQGLMELRFDQKSSKTEKTKRLKRISRFLDYLKIDKTRILFRISEADFEQTTYWFNPDEFEWLKKEDKNHKLIRGDELKQKSTNYFRKNKIL